MKITGTKKLLIIFFALICAFAAGLSVAVTRFASSGIAHAETSVSVRGSEAEEIKEEISAIEEEGIQDNALSEEEPVEEEYDERYDEDIIRQVANLLNSHYELVNLYCHVKEVDARELLVRLLEDEEKAAAVPTVSTYTGHAGHDGDDMIAPDSASSYAEEEDGDESSDPTAGFIKENNEQIFQDIFDFQSEYMNGEITLADGVEKNSWYIAPDEIEPYAETFYYYGYNYSNLVNRMLTSTPNDHGQIKHGRTIHHPVTGAANAVQQKLLYWQYYLELAPGESYTITRTNYSSTGYETWVGYDVNEHLSSVVNQILPWYGVSHWTIDGDAPSGTAFWIHFWFNMSTSDTSLRGYRARFCWNNVDGGKYNYRHNITNNNAAYANKSAHCLGFKFIVKRTSPVSPKLVDDTATNGGAVNLSTNTKTAYYEGKPAIITMSKDFGGGIIGYSFDETVTLKSRSAHGVEGTGGKNIEFQCSTAGTHVIKLKLLQPTTTSIPWPSTQHAANSNTGTMASTKMTWSDTTATEISFTLKIELQTTAKPSMVKDEGVDGYGRTKTVNYNGQFQTVSFQNCDPNFVGWAANGLTQASWTGTTLVLQQKERGTYNIQLFLKNPAGVSWVDGSTDVLEFTFNIKEMLIERPTQVGSNSYSKVVKYSGKEETLKISPASEEQLIIIASGLKYDFEDTDGDGIKDTCVFKMTDSGTVNIIVMPAEGYVWRDKKNDAINFTFTIEAVEIDVPRLQGISGNSKKVTFDPTPGWSAKLVIENIPKDAINVVTAMQ